MPSRPNRIQIIHELSKKRTLPEGPEQYESMGQGSPVLLLGLGPDPAAAAEMIPKNTDVFFIEAPDFWRQMSAEWKAAIPKNWQRLMPEPADDPALSAELQSLLESVSNRGRILLYTPNPRLFPSFWGPLLGVCRLYLLDKTKVQRRDAARDSLVLLPADKDALLVHEVADAFGELGLSVLSIDPETTAQSLPGILADARPSLFFSINFRGLDPYGELFYFLQAAGVPTAVWCVDNPLLRLTGIKADFWKQCLLLVTDDSFIRPLEHMGAGTVEHLPLACVPNFSSSHSAPADVEARVLYVGRPAFPGKTSFFAGLRIHHDMQEKARRLVDAGRRPDFHWWLEELHLNTPVALWPGTGARRAGLGAEEASLYRRIRCLQEAQKYLNPIVAGDEAWRSMVPELKDVRGPMDYYGTLADAYAKAAYVLNINGYLLPKGLTQRHFDVWSAGGVLITDDVPGLDIFPQHLCEPVLYKQPEELPQRINALEREPDLKRDLISAWQNLVVTEHTYTVRMERVLHLSGLL